MKFRTPLFLIAHLVVVGCSDDAKRPAGEPDGGMMGVPLSFAADIHPFLIESCSGGACHTAGSAVTPGHANPDADVAYASTQAMSFLMVPIHERMVARTSGMDPEAFGTMPPDCEGPPGSENCLTVAQFELLRDWSAQGAPP
jgi:hypothetical protein